LYHITNTICENTPTEVGAVFNGEYMLTMFLNFYIQLPWIVSVKTSSQVFTPSNQLTLTVKCWLALFSWRMRMTTRVTFGPHQHLNPAETDSKSSPLHTCHI